MQRKSLVLILVTAIITSIVASAIASTSTTYTWEKTFEVKQPQITAKIKISEGRIVGCPIQIWVCLRLNCSFVDKIRDCKDSCIYCPRECLCNVSGTYSANLYWHNATSGEWQLEKVLQEETNVTVTCEWQTKTYMFVPMLEGQYKVVVTFVVDSETYTFTKED